ncbi:MAG: hypothetical protein JO081_10155 [Alphaproteobacteria bacterium]|nr:hypothetical protein [Alphaproteobacteria bacterium]
MKGFVRAAAVVFAVWLTIAPVWADTAPKTLRFIPQADLGSIDPIWTTAYVTRNFGYLVFDTLFALDKNFQPQPVISLDGPEPQREPLLTPACPGLSCAVAEAAA